MRRSRHFVRASLSFVHGPAAPGQADLACASARRDSRSRRGLPLRSKTGDPHDDSARIRLPRAPFGGRRHQAARRPRPRCQAAGRRPQPVADDETALCATGASDRPEPHRGVARHPRRRRHRVHRRDDGRARPDRLHAAATQGAAAARSGQADRRPAGAQPRHPRRRHRPRRPRQRPPGDLHRARRHFRARRPEGQAPGPRR